MTGARTRLCLRRPILALVAQDAAPGAAAERIMQDALIHAGRPGCGGVVVYADGRVAGPLRLALQALFDRVAYGPPVDKATSLGPMISDRARNERRRSIAQLEAKGAVRLHQAAEPDLRLARMGWFAAPELLEVKDGAPDALAEATLGPTILLRTVDEGFDALALDPESWLETRVFGTLPSGLRAAASKQTFCVD